MKPRSKGHWIDTSYGVLGTIAVHGLVIALMFANFAIRREPPRPVQTTISATLVADESTVVEIREPTPPVQVEPEEPEPDPAEIERQREAEAERERQAELQRQREAEEAERERQAELQQQREAEEAERQRQAELQRQREAEAAERERQAELERQREAEEAERQRQAELERQRKAEAERKRQEELKRQREAAERARQAELEAQLQEALEAEEARAGAVQSGLLAQFEEQIRQAVERNWNKPANIPPGISCTVQVRQLRNGEVISVRVSDCPGGDALRSSIERAVLKASPLPPPPDPSLFDPNLRFNFEPDE